MNETIFEFCGCDVHKFQIEVAWLDQTGQKIRHGTYSNTPEGNHTFWVECQRLQTSKVAMESTGIYWKAFYESHPSEIQAIVFNPAMIKLKTRPKTDVKDAVWIARCLRADFIQPSNISFGEAATIKSLCRHRAQVVEEITHFKNQIHTLIDEYQRKLSTFTSGMNTHLALYCLTGLAEQNTLIELKAKNPTKRLLNGLVKYESEINRFLTPKLPDHVALQLNLALRGLLERSQACYEIEQRLVEFARDPAISDKLQILASIPGISGVSALQLFVELGRIERFPTKRHVTAWAGLCPRIKSSGGITTYGRITKRGNRHVRRIMFQVARASLRVKNNPLRPWYDRLKRRKPGRVAIVALARKLLIIVYTLLKTNQFFRGSELKTEVKVYSTAHKIVRGLTTEPIAPLLQVVTNWLDTPKKYRESISELFHTMYAEIRPKRGACS